MPHRIRSLIPLVISTCLTRTNVDSLARTIMLHRSKKVKAEWARKTVNLKPVYPPAVTTSPSIPRISAHPGSWRSPLSSANHGSVGTWTNSWKWREAVLECSGPGPTDLVTYKKRFEFHNKNMHLNSPGRQTNPLTQSQASAEPNPITWPCWKLSLNWRRRNC